MANAQPAGLEGIVAGPSSISNVYGEEGRLIYRGYDIKDLAENASFEEVAYLLWNGSLPTAGQLEAISGQLRAHRAVPPEVLEILQTLPRGASNMSLLRTGVSALALYDEDYGDNSNEANHRKAVRIVARTSTLVAALGRIEKGQQPVAPLPDGSEAENFLYMLHGEKPDETSARAYDVALILHADHEFNASTFTARVIVSTLADMYSGVTGAIGALSGPLHGGANEQVMKYLTALSESGQDPVEWVREQFANKVKIAGFGHRVYKTLDPRASYLREMGRRMAEKSGKPGFIQLSDTIQKAVNEAKGLNANVDFFSAGVFADMGLPTTLYSPVFACSRAAGWTAHIIEQQADNRIIRPRADYVGPDHLAWKPISER
jgi:citrate synthase